MQMQYCDRCKAEVPMLDEEEYAEVRREYEAAGRAAQDLIAFHGFSADAETVTALFDSVRRTYTRITGAPSIDPDEILRHRLGERDSR